MCVCVSHIFLCAKLKNLSENAKNVEKKKARNVAKTFLCLAVMEKLVYQLKQNVTKRKGM